ncbi:unnamed protein product [Somion occarium]|uniref:Uncharacterized protein n=1 Tax=Somion occarium TaxID=3059160 RepID=A0ABP1CEZ7_9APHY
MPADSEVDLRVHIRHLLLNYALTHLTTDYVAFTQNAVSELLSECLVPVSTVDPMNPILESSIYETLLRMYKLDGLDAYMEQWTTLPKVLQHLKSNLPHERRRQAPSTRCWDTDPDDVAWRSKRPISPILTKRSVLETPKLGRKEGQSFGPESQRQLLNSFKFSTVDVVEAPSPCYSAPQDILATRFILEADLRQPVIDMIKSNPASSKLSTSVVPNRKVQDFLRSSSPSPDFPRSMSPPIFSRARGPGGTLHDTRENLPKQFRMHTMEDLAAEKLVSAVEVDDGGFDLDNAHLVIVNGWAVYTSPSSTPSLASSKSDQIDELFLESSSPTPDMLYQRRLWTSAVDEHEIPRAEKFGGGGERAKRLGENESLSTFLAPAGITPVSQTRTPIQIADAQIVSTSKSQPSSPDITDSVMRQPSDLEEQIPTILDSESSNDIAQILAEIHGNAKLEDPVEWIVNERLDEKESLLMDVPRLPPPTDHPPNDMYFPKTLTSMVHCGKPRREDATETTTVVKTDNEGAFLKKVKGLQSLNIELNWRPFNYGTSIPTHEEVSRVLDDDIKSDFYANIEMSPDIIDAELSRLLKGVTIVYTSEGSQLHHATVSVREWYRHDDSTNSRAPLKNDCGFILTGQEMRRLNGRPEPAESCAEPDNFESAQENLDERSSKRRRLDDVQLDLDDLILNAPNTANSNMKPSEDSGVFFEELVDDELGSDGIFGQLSTDAEGFDGPRDDGDLFPDLDPIHTQSDYPSPVYRSSARYDSPFEVSGGYESRFHIPDNIRDSQVFLPLSMESTQRSTGPANDATQKSPDYLSAEPIISNHVKEDKTPGGDDVTPETAQPILDYAAIPSIAAPSVRQYLANFLQLRSTVARATEVSSPARDNTPLIHDSDANNFPQIQISNDWHVPTDLIDKNTLLLPTSYPIAAYLHTYMVSMDTVLKRGLIRQLSSPTCAIDFVERESLGDVHIILDDNTAVILVPLLSLPSQCQELTDTIAQASWRYNHLLVIFEAFPHSCYDKRGEETSRANLDPFSPPVVKSVNKLRRDLNLANEMGNKRKETMPEYAFACTVDEAAKFVRLYGDLAETRDETGGIIWDDRSWLETVNEEESEENDIAGFNGMNHFIAAIILTQTTFNEFLDQSSEERMQGFGSLIGIERMDNFNRLLERRAQYMELPSSSPITTSVSSLGLGVPVSHGSSFNALYQAAATHSTHYTVPLACDEQPTLYGS